MLDFWNDPASAGRNVTPPCLRPPIATINRAIGWAIRTFWAPHVFVRVRLGASSLGSRAKPAWCPQQLLPTLVLTTTRRPGVAGSVGWFAGDGRCVQQSRRRRTVCKLVVRDAKTALSATGPARSSLVLCNEVRKQKNAYISLNSLPMVMLDMFYI